eukprot:422814_1
MSYAQKCSRCGSSDNPWGAPSIALQIGITRNGGGASYGQCNVCGSYGHNNNSNRQQRLNSNIQTLYHATNTSAADSIIESQTMYRGKNDCLAGSGIYFAETAEDANRKAHHHGSILQADVKLGNQKTINSKDTSITHTKLLKQGKDSIKIKRNGDEHVVYNYDQVTNIKKYNPYGSY